MTSKTARQPSDMPLPIWLTTLAIVTAVALAACTKSPATVFTHTTNALAQKLVQPIDQKNAMNQAKQMAGMLSDAPACRAYKNRLLEAGKGSPYEGATQWKLVHTQRAACAAGCCK